MELKTDDAILNLLFERDEAALQEIQAAYGKLANDILNSREDSEECVNDMLMKVWQTIPPISRRKRRSAAESSLRRHGRRSRIRLFFRDP